METAAVARTLGDLVREFGVDVLTDQEIGLNRYNLFLADLEKQFDLLFESTIRETVTAISGSADGSESGQR